MVLLVRCIAGTICFLTFVFAIKYLPLSIFFMVMNASPFIMAILTCLWLKELITLVEVICMIGAFGGICLVGMSKQMSISQTDNGDVEAYQLGLLFAVISVFAQALTLVTTRRLKGLSVIVIQWYYALTSTLTCGFCILLQEKPFIVVF